MKYAINAILAAFIAAPLAFAAPIGAGNTSIPGDIQTWGTVITAEAGKDDGCGDGGCKKKTYLAGECGCTDCGCVNTKDDGCGDGGCKKKTDVADALAGKGKGKGKGEGCGEGGCEKGKTHLAEGCGKGDGDGCGKKKTHLAEGCGKGDGDGCGKKKTYLA